MQRKGPRDHQEGQIVTQASDQVKDHPEAVLDQIIINGKDMADPMRSYILNKNF